METIVGPKLTKAIKSHQCNFCLQEIPKGNLYLKSTHKHEHKVYTWKSHSYCSAIASTLKMFDYADEGVTDDFFIESIKYELQEIMSKTQPELKWRNCPVLPVVPLTRSINHKK